MPEMLALSSALTDASLTSLAQQGATITVSDRVSYYLLQNPSLTARRVAKPTNMSSNSCRIFPQDERLGDPGAMKAAYLKAFNDMMRYRATHSWPLGAASADPALVDVTAANYGPYVTIGLVDNFLHRDSAGRAEIGCSGDEYYRVSPSSWQVLPFDGCVESHRHLATLPDLLQLPP